MAENNGSSRLSTTQSEKFWCSMRTDFLNVLGLVRMVDEHVYILIMISSVNNFYYICNTILEGISREANIVDSIQYWSSFLFVLTRIMKSMFCEAEINEAASNILMSLHEFPASQWNVELKRLHQALSTETVALSGNRFFYITRRLIFGMIGTTFIYLLVMIDQVRDNVVQTPNPC
ncbi:Gr61a family protein [Megaselia abdita]